MQIVGSVTHGCLHDYVLEAMPSVGSFKTTKEFDDWFSKLPQRLLPDLLKFQDPYQKFLPDDGRDKFTHGGLHQSNIMISPTALLNVLAVVDWTHAG